MIKNFDRIKRWLALQFSVCLLIPLGLWVILGGHQAFSAFLGGMVAYLPSTFFATQFFRHQGARASKQIVKNFYKGEFLKIIFSVILFALVFTFYKVIPLTFFLTYITVIITHWFSPCIIKSNVT